MKRNRAYFIPVFIFILAILACSNQPAGTPGSNVEAANTAVALTVAALVPPPTPSASATNTPVPATPGPVTDTPVLATLAAATNTPLVAPTQVCDNAKFISETIPDGSVEIPGATFTKTWRLKNTGSCVWSSSYAIVFLNGNAMGAPSVVPLGGNVSPQQEVDLAIPMQAPATPGAYTGNWSLRNASGVLFGLGAGNGPFWIKINVISPTNTPSGPFLHLPVIPILLPASSQVVSQVSIPASGSAQAVATCPAGSIVTGGGFVGSSDLLVTSNFASGNGWKAVAENLSASAHGLNVYAECLSNSSGTTQQVYSQVTAAANGAGHTVINCPSGSVVTGGGFASNSNLAVYNNSASGNGWEVYANNKSATGQPLNAYAICLSGTSGTTQQLLNQVNVAANSSGQSVMACPSASLVNSGGYAGNQSLFVYNESASGSNWQVNAQNTSGTAQLLNSYALCLTLH